MKQGGQKFQITILQIRQKKAKMSDWKPKAAKSI